LPGNKTRRIMDYKFFFRQIVLIIWSPRKAWSNISEEDRQARHIRNNLLFPLLLLVAICSFLGSIIFSNVALQPVYSVFIAAKYFLLDLIVVYISALLYREIAKALDLPANFSLSFRIIVYSLIPFFICQMVSLMLESLAFVNILSLYGLWILWSGSEITFNPPDHKKMPMLIAALVVIAELYIGGSIALASVIDRIYFSFFA
jgi:hypothetical protein